MAPRSRTRKLPVSVQRELELATAVARDAIFTLHAVRAEALIQLAGERVPAPRMLQIYTRIHALQDHDAHFLTNRVLADIGRRTTKSRRPAPAPAAAESEEPEPPKTLIQHIRDRLRGRVLHDLRRGVELYAGITEVAVLKAHVKHAIRFVEILAPYGETIEGALETYKQSLAVRPGMADMLYFFVLERMAAEQPPVLAAEESTALAGEAAPKALQPARPPAAGPGIMGGRRAHAI